MADKRKRAITNLTNGETLYIYRLRKKWNQTKMAKALNMDIKTYRNCESARSKSGPKKPIKKLTLGEWCILQRRKNKIFQAAIAKQMNYCIFWIRQMERDLIDPSQLVEYWETRKK